VNEKLMEILFVRLENFAIVPNALVEVNSQSEQQLLKDNMCFFSVFSGVLAND
jgi:hypothetical protein